MKKLLSIVATTAILLNSVLAPVSVLAQEVTPTPEPTPEATATPEATPTPEETIAPTETPTASPAETPMESFSPTPEATLAPEETTTPEPTIEATATPANNEVQNTTAQDQQISSPTIVPTTAPTLSPTSTPEPKEDANVSVSVVTTNLFPETVQENSVVKLITDKLDYSPTEVAVITGSGFESGKTYSLTVSSSDDPATSTTSDITTDGSGSFNYNYQLDGNYRPNYSVTVKDEEQIVATTSFTDGNPSANPDQCANDPYPSSHTDGCGSNTNEWVKGNVNENKAVYLEGDSIPYRMLFDNLNTSVSHTVTIEWDTTKGGTHAIDYITTYNRTVTTANPCLGVTGCGSPTTFPIPRDPQVDNGSGIPVGQIPGNFTMFGGVITSVSSYSYPPNGTGFSGDNSARITITFTASQDNPVLAWGGHIATRTDWGSGNSAINIPGSPYHTRLIDLDGSGGNQDMSLSAEAVIYPASITITKDATPNGSTIFTFTGSPTPLTNFSLTDDGTSANTKVFSGITTFQTYTINETPIPTGWGFDSVSCSSTSSNGGSYTTNTSTVNVTVKEGENWTCTYSNSIKAGTLKVIKHVINDNGGTLVASDFALHVKSGTTDVNGSPLAGSETGTNYTLSGGIYNVSENTPPDGYKMTGFSGDCDLSGSVTVVAGQTKTCTITNDDIAPKLTLVKNVTNTDGGTALASDWTLSAFGTGGFSGTGTQDPILNKATLGPTSVKANVAYTLSESGAFTNYTAGNWSCNGGVMGDAAPTITLQPGQDVICSITNTHYKNSPTISTVLSESSVNVGGAVHDTATLTGATSNAGGTVTYNVYSDSSCSTLFAGPGVKTVTNGSIPNSDDVTFTKAGDYYWQASYSGDTNNNSALSACTEEHLVVNKVNPAISTLPSPTTALLGATIADTATLSGGFNPTGNIAFSLYDPDNTNCDPASRMWYEEVTVNGNGSYSTSNFNNTIKAGTWRWVASYSGDTNNNSISGGCSDELVTINKADTSVATHVYNGEGQDITNSTDTLGANIHDSATVSGQVGVIGITGTITYNFYENNSCTGELAGSETTTISGYPFTTSSSTKLNMGAGSYSYMATYNGDSNYNGSTGICEPFSIGKADSSVTTEVHNSDHQDVTNQTLNPGISVHDSATILGTSQSFRPTGNVTYYFFTNGSCYGETADSETVEVGSETEARLISEPGSYSYQANYEGDNNFNSSVGECEPFTVGSPSISIAKTNNSGSGVRAGSTITYTLTISNTGSMNLDNLKISDVLPGGFSYVLGSTTGAIISDPTISGNILTWNIESLSAEQSITISYQASTATNLSDGTYTNFATCRAYFGDEGSVECNDANSEVSIGSTFGYSGNVAGQVLGASTMLPGTGSPTVLVIIGLGFLGTGIALNIASRKKYAKK